MNNSKDWINYKGSSKKPIDFDDFWDKKISQVETHKFSYTLVKKNINSNVALFFDLFFEAIDGAKIHAQLVTPKNLKKRYPGSLWFHGYHCDSGDWVDKIGVVAEGIVILALDCRGQGGESEDNTKTVGMTTKGLIVRGIEEGHSNLYFVRQFLDLASAAKILMNFDYVDENEITTRGSSQGGGLAIACAALVPKVKNVIATYPFLSDYRKAYSLDCQNTAFEELSYWFQFKDPLHKKEEWFFQELEYIDIQNLAPRIQATVHWIVGGSDKIVPPITQMATYNKIRSTKLLYILPEFGHEYLPKISDYLFNINTNINE